MNRVKLANFKNSDLSFTLPPEMSTQTIPNSVADCVPILSILNEEHGPKDQIYNHH